MVGFYTIGSLFNCFHSILKLGLQFILQFYFNCIVSVSYTHLDVYKRQHWLASIRNTSSVVLIKLLKTLSEVLRTKLAQTKFLWAGGRYPKCCHLHLSHINRTINRVGSLCRLVTSPHLERDVSCYNNFMCNEL